MTPSVRVETVLKRALGLRKNGHDCVLEELEMYGLSVLRNMLHSGELEIDSASALRVWSLDAAAKHKSFAATLGDATVRHALREAIKEGKR